LGALRITTRKLCNIVIFLETLGFLAINQKVNKVYKSRILGDYLTDNLVFVDE
jgi:hypothetical protein